MLTNRIAPYRHLIASEKKIGKAMQEDDKGKGRCFLPVSRRRFVQGLAAGGAVAALDWRAGWAFAETGQQQTLATLTGKDFELTIDSLPVKFSGRRSAATAVNGSVPGPILRWREGDTVTIAVTNRLPTPTSIHWHGVRVPAEMDGVPGLSFAGIAPGKTFVLESSLRFSSNFHRQALTHAKTTKHSQHGRLSILLIPLGVGRFRLFALGQVPVTNRLLYH
jgi:hypothetical protein